MQAPGPACSRLAQRTSYCSWLCLCVTTARKPNTQTTRAFCWQPCRPCVSREASQHGRQPSGPGSSSNRIRGPPGQHEPQPPDRWDASVGCASTDCYQHKVAVCRCGAMTSSVRRNLANALITLKCMHPTHLHKGWACCSTVQRRLHSCTGNAELPGVLCWPLSCVVQVPGSKTTEAVGSCRPHRRSSCCGWLRQLPLRPSCCW